MRLFPRFTATHNTSAPPWPSYQVRANGVLASSAVGICTQRAYVYGTITASSLGLSGGMVSRPRRLPDAKHFARTHDAPFSS